MENTEPSELSPVQGQTELRVKVAELCGWTFTTDWMPPKSIQDGNKHLLPDYLNDLNACHEFEKGLTREQRAKYWKRLQYISGNMEVFSTAEERCRAFVKTIEALPSPNGTDSSSATRETDLEEQRDVAAKDAEVPEMARYEAHESERKTVHNWLNDLAIPREEFGKPICLLRRLWIVCDRLRENASSLRLAREMISDIAEALTWLDEFVEEPEYFPGNGDRQWWNERRQGIRGYAKKLRLSLNDTRSDGASGVPPKSSPPSPSLPVIEGEKEKGFREQGGAI